MATAMNAIETRRTVTADTVVELEVAIEDPSPFVAALAARLEATITYRGLTYDERGRPLAFFHAGRAVEEVPPSAAAIEGVADVTILSTHDGGTHLEVTVDDDSFTLLTEHGAEIRRFDAGTTSANRTLRSGSGDPGVELLGYREIDRPTRMPGDLMAQLESSLTERQFTALRKAYYAEYSEWPRNVSGEDLAQSIDISRSTFHQHLRAAQRKLLDELFDEDPTSEG